MRPHRRQPTRLRCPCHSPGKNTGVGCHFLLQCMKVKCEREVAQSCLTLSDPMDCSPPGSSIHGIFQARVLEWGAIAFSHVGADHTSSYLSQMLRLRLFSENTYPTLYHFWTWRHRWWFKLAFEGKKKMLKIKKSKETFQLFTISIRMTQFLITSAYSSLFPR